MHSRLACQHRELYDINCLSLTCLEKRCQTSEANFNDVGALPKSLLRIRLPISFQNVS